MPRPPKDPADRVLRACISYRPSQAEKVKRLTAEKRLSEICQEAIDRCSGSS